MSNVTVIQRTQKIIVNSATGTVSVVNAGPQGPAGAAGDGSGLALKVSKAGDTMTGALILHGDPTVPLGAATRQFVLANSGGGGGGSGNLDGGTPTSTYGGTTAVDGGTP